MIKINLYNIERKSRITNKEIIEATGLSTLVVSHLLNGIPHDYKLSTLEKICKYFKCSILDIIEEDDEERIVNKK